MNIHSHEVLTIHTNGDRRMVVDVVVATYISNNNIEVVLHRVKQKTGEKFSRLNSSFFEAAAAAPAYLFFSMFKLERRKR